jgi:hypothetical protein
MDKIQIFFSSNGQGMLRVVGAVFRAAWIRWK